MKFNKKRLAALSLSAVMTFSVTTSVFAEEPIVADPPVAAAENPVSSEIQVVVDGKVLDMGDAKPILSKDQVFVPFTAFFKAIGAETSYESSTKTATAIKNDVVASFSINRLDITIKENGDTSVLQSEGAPFLQGDSTYVPVVSAAKALGYNAGFDTTTNKVLIVDVNKIAKTYSDKFKIMDKFMAYNQKLSQKNAEYKGDFNMVMNMMDGESIVPITAKGTLDMFTNKTKADMKLAMNVDISKLLTTLTGTSTPDAETAAMAELLKNIVIDYRLDLSTGKYYIKSPLISTLMEMNGNVWLEVDMNDMLEQMGMGSSIFTQMMKMNEASNFTDSLTIMLRALPIKSEQDILVMDTMMAQMVKMYSDDAFVKEGDKYVSTMKETQSGFESVMKMTLKVNSGDQVIAYSMDMSMTEKGVPMMTLTAAMDQSNNMTMNMKMEVPELMNMVFDMKMTMKETTVNPSGVPSGNDVIVPFMEALQ